MKKNKKWIIYVIFHKQLIDKHYTVDPSFDHQYYAFIKCNEKFKARYNKKFGYNIIFEKDLNFYDKTLQKKMYMAPSAIYHAYKNKLHEKYDYIGFMEYDIALESLNKETPNKITDYISQAIAKNNEIIMPISFKHPIKTFWNQEEIKMNGINAMTQIVKDYNKFFKTSHDVDSLKQSKEPACSQQSFLTDKKTFKKIMSFIEYVIENKLAERPDSWRRPSTLLDRYFALSLFLENVKIVPLSLEHKNMKRWEDNIPLWKKIIKNIKNKF